MHLYGVFGAGGFGREVMPLARQMLSSRATEDYELVFVVDSPESGSTINGHRVMSRADFLAARADRKHFNIAIADHVARRAIASALEEGGAIPFTIAAREHVCLDRNEIGDGAILCSYVTVTSNARIGRYFHANIYSYIAHDCVIGDFVTFAPSVHCNGRVVVEDDVYIGTGAVLRQGSDEKPIVIGKGAIVGMGAVVTKSVPPGITVIGNPARPLPQS